MRTLLLFLFLATTATAQLQPPVAPALRGGMPPVAPLPTPPRRTALAETAATPTHTPKGEAPKGEVHDHGHGHSDDDGHDHHAHEAAAAPGAPAPKDAHAGHSHGGHSHSHGHSHTATAAGHLEGAALLAYCRANDSSESAIPFHPHHLTSPLILLLVSALGVYFSFLTTYYANVQATTHAPSRFPYWVRRWANHATFLGKHFGTGVILATAYIHMYPEAGGALADPCVGLMLGMGEEGYEQLPAVVLLLAAFCMHAIEYAAGEKARRREARERRERMEIGLPVAVDPHDPQRPIDAMAWFDGKGQLSSSDHGHSHGHTHGDAAALFAVNDSHAQRIATYLLEAFVLLHSVLIGLTLGLAPPTSPSYMPLLIALVFHQFFEGLALGARIGATCPLERKLFGLFLCALFALATPAGTALGIVTRNAFPARSARVLLVRGIVDAAAAGVLMYAGWVHLLDGEMTRSAEFATKSGRWKVSGFAALWLGAAVMAVIGKWA